MFIVGQDTVSVPEKCAGYFLEVGGRRSSSPADRAEMLDSGKSGRAGNQINVMRRRNTRK